MLPRVLPITARALDVFGAGGGARPESTPEVDSLRSHQPGSPATRIHWPTVARTGELMERALTPGGRPARARDARHRRRRLRARLDSRAAGDRVAVRPSRAALGVPAPLPGDLRASAIAPDLRAWPALHARLALLDRGRRRRPRARPERAPDARLRDRLRHGLTATGRPLLPGRTEPALPEPAALAVAGLAVELVRSAAAAGEADEAPPPPSPSRAPRRCARLPCERTGRARPLALRLLAFAALAALASVRFAALIAHPPALRVLVLVALATGAVGHSRPARRCARVRLRCSSDSRCLQPSRSSRCAWRASRPPTPGRGAGAGSRARSAAG